MAERWIDGRPRYTDDQIITALRLRGTQLGAYCLLRGDEHIRKVPGYFGDRCARLRARAAATIPRESVAAVPVREAAAEPSSAKGQGREEAGPVADEKPPDRDRCVHVPFAGRVVVVSDVHAPYHDARAWAAFVAAVRLLRPDGLVIGGDFLDCYSISSHSRDPKRRANLAWEVDTAAVLLAELTEAAPTARKWYLEGNHEYRLPRYIADRAPELDGMAMSLAERMRFDRLGWTWVDSQSYLQTGKMCFAHGWRCGKYALPQSVQEWGGCLAFGHSHRLGVWYSGDVRGSDHVGINTGWLGDVGAIDYRYRATAERDWQHGFGVIEIAENGTAFAHAVPVIDGVTMVGNRTVRG
jgi:hypothetical protein